MRVIDITGNKYNKWTVIERAENDKNGGARWLCRCECGNEKIVQASHLKNGASQSCGCLNKERSRQAHTKHSMSNERLYRTYKHMMNRCNNANVDGYELYGGRGISVCDEWQEFIPFKEWALNNGYNDNLTLDRIDCNGNYEPANCRWITIKEQQCNKRNNHLVTYKGITKTISQWAEKKGMQYNTLYARLTRYGWSIERALET